MPLSLLSSVFGSAFGFLQNWLEKKQDSKSQLQMRELELKYQAQCQQSNSNRSNNDVYISQNNIAIEQERTIQSENQTYTNLMKAIAH